MSITSKSAVPDKGLSRHERVVKSTDFREAFDQGQRQVGKFMVMWLRSGDDACLRLGVVTSKRTFRLSPHRSRARRLLREAFRLNRSQLSGEYDLILVGRRRILDVKRQDVEKDLLALAKKAGILGCGEG